jgi:membrane protease YdiL (CAAX protease family)
MTSIRTLADRHPVAAAFACAAAQFLLTVAILQIGAALVPPHYRGAVRLTAFASTVVLPLALAQALGLWPRLGLAWRDVKPAPAFLAGLLICVLFVLPGLRVPAGHTVGGEVLMQFVNAFGEELLFRGVIFALLARLPAGRAMLLNGLLFGAMHLIHAFMGASWGEALQWAAFTAMAGTMFAAVRHAGGSLWLCVLLHMLLNLAKVFSNLDAAVGPQASLLVQRLANGLELLLAWWVVRGGLRAGGGPARIEPSRQM